MFDNYNLKLFTLELLESFQISALRGTGKLRVQNTLPGTTKHASIN